MSRKPLLEIDAFDDFSRVTERSVYRPLPDDWHVGVSDVAGSTKAIEAGRYKAVNMAGASAIGALMNGLGRRDFPFTFAGDGAQFAVPGEHAAVARDVLARTARWSADELGLDLRVATIPVADIRAAGREVLVAHHAPSDAVIFAMFAGGGMEWAEAELKAGRRAIEPARPGARPDLSGLSCRWKPIRAQSGVMLSLVVRQGEEAPLARYFAALQEVVRFIDAEARGGNPMASGGPAFGSPFAGLDLEMRATCGSRGPRRDKLGLLLWRVFAWLVVVTGSRVGAFDPERYRRQTAQNTDFRKFHDGLDMTIDCTPQACERIEAMLSRLEAKGVIRYGTFRQKEALMTCIVPSYTADDHLHFIDGAQGGYAEAARRLKA